MLSESNRENLKMAMRRKEHFNFPPMTSELGHRRKKSSQYLKGYQEKNGTIRREPCLKESQKTEGVRKEEVCDEKEFVNYGVGIPESTVEGEDINAIGSVEVRHEGTVSWGEGTGFVYQQLRVQNQ